MKSAMTKEQLAEIEARAETTHAYFSTKSACADLRALIAHIRKLEAENERLRRSCDEWKAEWLSNREAMGGGGG